MTTKIQREEKVEIILRVIVMYLAGVGAGLAVAAFLLFFGMAWYKIWELL